MKIMEIVSLVFLSFMVVAMTSTSAIAGERLIVVTQPEHVRIVSRLLGPQIEVKLLLPAGAASNECRAINTYVRALGTPAALLTESGQDDGLRRLWSERLINSTGTMAIDVPRGLLGGGKGARRNIGDFVAMKQLADCLIARLPTLRTEISKNQKTIVAELRQLTKGTTLVSLAEPSAHSAP